MRSGGAAIRSRPAGAGDAPVARREIRTRALPFVAAIGLSSFALFCLELVAGQVVQPIFGGAPAVWATTLCFFTAVLFLGYLYAHAVITRLPLRLGIALHLGVALVAVIAAVAAPSRPGSLRIAGLADAPNVLLALTVIAGAPAFLFATTTPLISAWYARARAAGDERAAGDARAAGEGRAQAAAGPAGRGAATLEPPGRGRDAFWLYAASNGASFAAVLGYPFFIQPFLALSVQRSLIAAMAVAFTALLVAIAVWLRGMSGTTAELPATPGRAVDGELGEAAASGQPTWRRQLRWLAAAFVPAGLLSATTTYITTDLVSAPFLWVWPLAIYLASFVVAFSDRGRRMLPRIERLVPAAATLLWVPWLVFGSWPVVALLLVELTSFGVLACAIHGRLAADRPGEPHLTRFYLVLSAGGVLATAFVAVAAPLVFPDVYEYPLLIVAALAVLSIYRSPLEAAVWSPVGSLRAAALVAGRRLVPFAVMGLAFLVLIFAQRSQVPLVTLLLASGAAVIAVARSYRSLATASALAIVGLSVLQSANPVFKERTFFGVLQIRAADGGASRAEYSGTTLHGIQFIDARRSIPTSYYVRTGPLGDVFDDLAHRSQAASIAVVGLGTGTIAAYERPTDTMTFFEIDPAVVDLARDPRWFTYLAGAPVLPRVVVGDGRLSLESQPAGSFDVLVLDAFSSDNVPAHLLTREALQTYRRSMRPGGIIIFHISNRSYDLAPGIVSTAQSMGLAGRQLGYEPGPARVRDEGADGSDWVVVGDFADITRFVQRGWGSPRPGPVLTDDFSDLLRMLRAFQF